MQVSRSGYYSWVQRRKEYEFPERKEKMIEEIQHIHEKFYQSYGSRRISKELQKLGYSVGREKARRLMQQANIQVRQKKKFVMTTDSKHSLWIAKNHLNQEFHIKERNKVWVGDITYLRTKQGWGYLAVVLDLFSRRVVGWELLDHPPALG